MRITTVPLLLILLSVFANAQDLTHARKIARLTAISQGENVLQHADPNFHFIELSEGVSEHYLTNQGVEIYRRLGKNTFVVKKSSRATTLSREKVKQNSEVNVSWKLADDVTLQRGHFVVKTDPSAPELHRGSGLNVVSRNGVYLRVEITLDKGWAELLRNEHVLYVGRESFEAIEESRVLDLNLNPNHVNQVHDALPELNGNGIAISLKELQYSIGDLDLIGRHVPSSLGATDVSPHATDMATIAAGAGNSIRTKSESYIIYFRRSFSRHRR
jgi:hypothetical protein